MQPTVEQQRQKLADALMARARTALPQYSAEWTQMSDADPGVTLLQLFAFVTERLLATPPGVSARATAVAEHLASAARAVADAQATVDGCALQRVHYYTGQLLTTEDLQQEQAYVRSRLRRLTHALLGAGVVSGLQVSVTSGTGRQRQDVVVQPGLAVDRHGEDLVLCLQHQRPLPARGTALFIQLRHVETLTAPVPQAASASPGDESRYSRVEERAEISLTPEVDDDAVPLARLVFERGGWRVDGRWRAGKRIRHKSR